ncbi:hypothetical protein IWW38_005568 [Coemansia aciculifera]|uniref:Uncharacterized protein n=1 Tax=Coemansia aciculifera TaxID=417176 RepID=A0ACC1LVH8_9FUNG|nr:hypothetical protein IWW38_005568 [Coemansia aciculifera]
MDSQDDISVFQAFDAYDFAHDTAFQAGLQSMGLNKDDSKVLEEAKIFYYSRRVAPIDIERYTAWKAATSGQATLEPRQATPPPSVPFAQVVDMIRRGETIPGIREIPDGINSHTPSTSTSVAPRKPWEQKEEEEEQ